MCDVPDILYKYRPITDDDRNGGNNDFTKRIFTRGELYFPSFSQLNDPNECLFAYSSEIDIAVSQEELHKYPDFLEREDLSDGGIRLKVPGAIGAQRVRERIDKMYGVLCLTEDPRNLLMYDHYSGGHTGICIGIDWKKLDLVYRETKQHQIPRKIKYCSIPPHIDPIQFQPEKFNDIFHTKWEEYQHEKEFRLLFTPGVYAAPQKVLSAIKEIIFGCATSQNDRVKIMNWAKNLSVSYYEVRLVPGAYRLECKIIA